MVFRGTLCVRRKLTPYRQQILYFVDIFLGVLQISCFSQFLIRVLNIYVCSLLVVDISCCYTTVYQLKAAFDCIFTVPIISTTGCPSSSWRQTNIAHARNIFITWWELVAHSETRFGVSSFLTHCLVNNLTEKSTQEQKWSNRTPLHVRPILATNSQDTKESQ